MNLFEKMDYFLRDGGWSIQIVVTLLLTLLVSIVLQWLVRRKRNTVHAHRDTWKYAIFSALSAPLRVFIWVGGITIALNILHDRFPVHILSSLLNLQPTLSILIVGWFMLRLTRHGFKLATEHRSNMSMATLDVLEKTATIAIVIALALSILPNLGISISGLLAFGGVGGIVVGLAAKDMLANFFGALMLHFDRPFAIGDWVLLPEKDIEGNVEHIGWRKVTLRTPDTRLVFIPNSMFGNLILANPGRMTHRRILETIGVRYNDIDKLPQITEAIRKLLHGNPHLDQTSGMVAHLDKFSAYSVDIIVSAFTRRTTWADYLALKEGILLEINRIITEHGAKIAFPTQALQIESLPQAEAALRSA
ncbi:MAG TPA: mechanosensitive ion channel family protein [Rickettsiales bacterium]|nr:mechanosensitive ion channel family protein [Rickettsiales bacterium]